MASKLAPGFGSVAGSRASPDTLLDNSVGVTEGKCNFLTVANTDATNWLFLKAHDDPGPYVIALPGATATIARGPGNANNLTKIIGFATTPSEAGTATLTAAIVARKLA